MKKTRLPIIIGNPNGPWLEMRDVYFWISPPKQGNLTILDKKGNLNPLRERQLIFIEDFLYGLNRILWADNDITIELRKTAGILRKYEQHDTSENIAPTYAIRTTILKKVALTFDLTALLKGKQQRKKGVQEFFLKNLCTNLFLSAKKGTMTAIMGPSGCGKSVFIKMLAGCNRPSNGRILVNDMPLNKMMGKVGYVPQGDLLLPELTGKLSLDYKLKLCAPFLTSHERDSIIKHVADSLDLQLETLDMRIGRVESQGKYPSGGQRRRISLAHELVRFPEILILDEPTSGLSASDAENVVELLRKLADSLEMTIIASIHSPNSFMFNKFDDLLLVGLGGRICYYGPVANSMEEVLQDTTGTPDELMNKVNEENGWMEALITNYVHCMQSPGNSKQYFPTEF